MVLADSFSILILAMLALSQIFWQNVVSSKRRATAYGIMKMTGGFAGAFITVWLGKSTDAGNPQKDFAMLGGIVAFALIIQLWFLRPKATTVE
jgi:MFS-type transporter involved in bile tolerance (Atg22 family)